MDRLANEFRIEAWTFLSSTRLFDLEMPTLSLQGSDTALLVFVPLLLGRLHGTPDPRAS